MTELVTIAGVETQRITFKDQPVCTTQQLAQFYGCTEKNLSDNFSYQQERFEEGKHFVKLEGNALRAFKEQPENSGSVGLRAASLILWTEMGAARHAKMLTTDKAWEVFEEMEGTYFRAKEAAATLPQTEKAKRPRVSERATARPLPSPAISSRFASCWAWTTAWPRSSPPRKCATPRAWTSRRC